uniref:Uncharacterized protein n=1 Tax=Cucumis melo TaxID=3656 RepID=A0A9I9EEZ5_CUCME
MKDVGQSQYAEGCKIKDKLLEISKAEPKSNSKDLRGLQCSSKISNKESSIWPSEGQLETRKHA